MVSNVRIVSKAISGNGLKSPTLTELENKKQVRKSLCYATKLSKGKVLHDDDFIALRPEGGVNPMLIDDFIGKSLKKDVDSFQLVDQNDIE